MERSLSSAGRRGAGLLCLALFLIACLGPHLPFLHADHLRSEAHAAGIPGSAGEKALAEATGEVHACLLCLWKSHRDGNAWEGTQPAVQAFPSSSSPAFQESDGAASRGLIAAAPARAPPATA